MEIHYPIPPLKIKENKKCIEYTSVECTKIKIEVDGDKCTGCGTCKFHCPKGGKIWIIEDAAMATNLRFCLGCIECASKCPQQAIEYIRCGTGCQ